MLPPTACLPEMSSRSSSTPWTLLPRIPQVGSSARPPVAAPPWRTLPPPSAPVARLTLWWSQMPPLASSRCNCWVLAVGGSWPAPPCSPRKVSSVVNSTLVQTLAGLTSGFGADLASVGAQLTQSLTTLLLVATTSDGAKQGDGSALANLLNSGNFQQSFRSVITITWDVAQALVRTGDYLVRTLPKAERLLSASLAPARQLANATLLPAVRTIGAPFSGSPANLPEEATRAACGNHDKGFCPPVP